MKNIPLVIFGLVMTAIGFSPLHAQMSSFTFQGRLNLNGNPANGEYDFMFRLLNDPTNGVAVPVIPIALAVPITNGLFTTGMDFGAENFDGANRWLEINVRTNGGGPFSTLSPRQLMTPTPYAITANTASNLLGALPAGQISGTIPDASLPASPGFSGTVTANNFSGNGANLSAVNAVALGGLPSSSFWKTTGNAGTTASTHFLGTTDNQPLELKINGLRALRLEDNGDGSDGLAFPDGAPNVVAGSPVNFVGSGIVGATISGGGATNYGGDISTNMILADYATVGGGLANRILESSIASTIAGGRLNVVGSNSFFGTIAGGFQNGIGDNSYHSAIAGGVGNVIGANSYDSTIAGGAGNNIAGGSQDSSIAGGLYNEISTNSYYGVIGGGLNNRIAADSFNSTIGGGGNNNVAASSLIATIAGGANNHIDTFSQSSVIGGGINNHIGDFSPWATVAGGVLNDIDTNAYASFIGGGFDNNILAWSHEATIAGGRLNNIGDSSYASAIGGGRENSIGDNSGYGMIAGGNLNSIGTNAGANVIGGGIANKIGDYSWEAAIAGGVNNDIGTNSSSGAIGGGYANTIGGNSAFATIPGGRENSATNYAFAAGRQAKADHQGSFVWGDSTEASIASTNANSVTMRASGGYRFFSDSTATVGAFLAPGSGSWTSMSDRNAKENFQAADARAVLEKLIALPVQTWNYKSQDAGIRHIGLMAQDFKAAFGIGESDTGISTVDADGVALAAIQGLNQKLEAARAQNAELARRLEKLEALLRDLSANR